MNVGIIGLGLIGGSLARDLSAKGHHVLGADRSRATLKGARRAGAIAGMLGPRLEDLGAVDLCIVALPVDATRRILEHHAARLVRIPAVTDVGSTKGSIMRVAARAGLSANFVGSHPMAGGEVSGWSASRLDLFRGQRVYICPPPRATDASVRLVRRLWRTVGGRMEIIDPPGHDRLLAATSHLPQVVALALSMLYADARIRRGNLGRGGREMTRLAASNGEMWSAIFADHPNNMTSTIRRLRRALEQIEEKVAARDVAALRRLMRLTNAWSRK